EWLTKDGRRRHIAWASSVLRASTGRVRRVVSAGVDVTELRRAGERAARGERMVELGQLAATLVHEIANPLNAALLHVGLAQRRLPALSGEAAGAVAQSLDVVRDELQRLEQLVRASVAFGTPPPLALARGDLWLPAARAAERLLPAARDAGVVVTVEPP